MNQRDLWASTPAENVATWRQQAALAAEMRAQAVALERQADFAANLGRQRLQALGLDQDHQDQAERRVRQDFLRIIQALYDEASRVELAITIEVANDVLAALRPHPPEAVRYALGYCANGCLRPRYDDTDYCLECLHQHSVPDSDAIS